MTTTRSFFSWVTSQLAVGSAPMSHAQLDALRDQGIRAILNLCGEFSDLHTIEREHGFEVYYLPIADEDAPDLKTMEPALEWLDEALYLGKKVYIHCRHGIGRTGTILNLYLLRKGLGHKMAAKILRNLRAKPANFEQWWTVRKYGRRTGKLTLREPCLEVPKGVDLAPFLQEYENIRDEVDRLRAGKQDLSICGRDSMACCTTPIRMTLVEAEYLRRVQDAQLPSKVRKEIIERAAIVARKEREAKGTVAAEGRHCLVGTQTLCPFSHKGKCLVFDNRPLQCRTYGMPITAAHDLWEEMAPALDQISADLFFVLTGSFPPAELPLFSLPDVASGRYASMVFHLIKQGRQTA
jgi:Fe-S-cluster containining protein